MENDHTLNMIAVIIASSYHVIYTYMYIHVYTNVTVKGIMSKNIMLCSSVESEHVLIHI